MTWESEWKVLADRLELWSELVDGTMRMLESSGALRERANRALGQEAHEIVEAIEALDLPPWLKDEIAAAKTRLGGIENMIDGERVINAQWIVLAAMRIPLDKAARSNEGPRRRLVDRAFLHLNRTLAVDGDVRARWRKAFNANEAKCEQLGGLHLLSHGIYGFKADAGSGRTDLILGDKLMVNEDVRAAEAMVLTEWKLAREGDSPESKCTEARTQAAIYTTSELGGFELRRHRYIVIVSEKQCTLLPSETDREVTYHYVNIAIEPRAPSEESRRSRRRSRRRKT